VRVLDCYACPVRDSDGVPCFDKHGSSIGPHYPSRRVIQRGDRPAGPNRGFTFGDSARSRRGRVLEGRMACEGISLRLRARGVARGFGIGVP
jgi:hypothetical protein